MTALAAVALAVTSSACGAEGPSEAVGGLPVTVSSAPAPGPSSTSPAAPTTGSPPPVESQAPSGPGVVVTPAGVVVPVLAERGDALVVRTPCGNERTITQGRRVRQATVVLDPGHGGAEAGARSPSGLAEAPVNLDVARAAQAELDREGVSAVLTRTAEYEVSLPTRADIAKSLSAKAFVSVHHNAVPDGPHPGPGTETYYQQASADSKRLAGLVQEEVYKALSAYDAAWVADTDAGAKYRPGSRGDYYAMLRLPAPVTSVLAELAFITNPPEAALLARPDVRAREGAAVARGILRYLRTSDPGSMFTVPYPRTDPPGDGAARRCQDPEL
ncbi:MAG TPA: N-acetylmuramoyl-L-alanine amidase [Acidimicrobiales bacterium]|nr:N-acetylmuramoyl-L-alanine amidase [Acidimicrobiales bacterium]